VAPPPGFNTSGVITCSPVDATTGDTYCLIGSLGGFGVHDEYRHYRFHPATLEFEALPLPPAAAVVNHVNLFLDRARRRVVALPAREDSVQYRVSTGQYAYDIATRTWSTLNDIPSFVDVGEARGMWQHPTENWGVVTGGQDTHDYTSSSLVYRIDFTAVNVTWEPLALLPNAGFSHVVLDADAVPPGFPAGDGQLRLYVVAGAVAPGVESYGSGDTYVGTVPQEPDPALRSSSLLIPRQQPPGGGTGLRPGQLRVVSAFYGPHNVRDQVQALLDGGMRVVHMGGGVPFPDNFVLPDSLAVPGQARGKFGMTATLLETPLEGTPYTRHVSCASTGACRFY
jgi:hypothetical protein